MATDPKCPDEEIARYTCYRTNQSIQIDGHLDEAVWQKAPRSERFVDMVTGDRFWRGLYCGAEPVCLTHHTHVWVTFMGHGFSHHQQSINYLGTPELRDYRDDLGYEVRDLFLDNAWLIESWKGHRPKRISAILDGKSVGWIGYVALPFLSDYRGRPVIGIYSMGVNQNSRRQGIASSLINYLFNMTCEQGVAEILVGTTVEFHIFLPLLVCDAQRNMPNA